jgi:arylsulfatase A-like enzyme
MTASNVLVVMTDQHRAGLTAGEGFACDTMPFLDGLAARGTRFRRAYTTSPACVPARTSLLTGRFPKATGVRQNSAAAHVPRTDDLLDVLGAAGHSLHLAGKPHVYRGEADFDTYAAPYLHESGPPGRGSAEQGEFERWLRELDHGVSGEPTFPEPHNPYQVPERRCGPEAAEAKGRAYAWLRRLIEEKRPGYDDGWRRYRANYLGMLRLIDDQLRRFAAHLDARGLWTTRSCSSSVTTATTSAITDCSARAPACPSA